MRVINSEDLSREIEVEEKRLGVDGRIMIRVSGTEPYIRVMVESLDANISKITAQHLSLLISQIDNSVNN